MQLSSNCPDGPIAFRRGYSELVNCILWDDKNTENGDNREFYGGGVAAKPSAGWGSGSADYCDVKGGWDTGGGANNISVDPVFIDAANSNLRVKVVSPCIDVGYSNTFPVVDIRGITRPQASGRTLGQ